MVPNTYVSPNDARVAAREAEYVAYLTANGMPSDLELADALNRAMAFDDGQS